ncbi:hypothetical protein JCGZ_01043 [Jatropha curcas]|uniref:Cytochrome P450 n=2 Tax=Jatropha curcas TaxID=180498 RepID=A0A067KSW0_JATCU|nr:hypothetical protein JCGZ_01043 [Jatropha curcas]
MHLQLGEVTTIFITSPEIAKEVLKTLDIVLARRPFLQAVKLVTYNFTDVAFSPYGEYWRQLRKICTMELLTAKRVQSFGSIRQEEGSKLIRDISSNAGSPINFSKILTSSGYKIISRAAFGQVWNGEDVFLKAVNDLTEESAGFSLVDFYPSKKFLQLFTSSGQKLQRVFQQVDTIMQNIIDNHRARKREAKSGDDAELEDFVDVLLKVQEQKDLELPLTDDNMKAVIFDMFSAGSDSSSTTIIWAMSELVKNPTVMEKAQAEVRRVFSKKGRVDEEGIEELHYLKAVAKETLRLHAPGPLLLPRECAENCVINDFDIPAKSRIAVNFWAIGRDPQYWTEPERFNPERFLDCPVDYNYKGTNYTYLPFGSGRRICPGMSFAIANMEFTLAQMLFYFDWKLPNGLPGESLDMTEKFGVTVRRESDLILIPFPYIPASVN